MGKLLEGGPGCGSNLQSLTNEVPIHPLVQEMLRIEPPPRMTWYDTRPHTEASLMASLMKLANDEMVDIINWAKAIPGDYTS